MSQKTKIGYRHPPKRTRFKKGVSGNPKGRPKGSLNLKTDLEQELLKPINIPGKNGKFQKVSRQRAMIMKLISKALQGDVRAGESLLKLIQRLFPELEVSAPSISFDESDETILRRYEKRILERGVEVHG